jgi:uncharacterized membrane protein YgdD (TMEM256/DUF423 family)
MRRNHIGMAMIMLALGIAAGAMGAHSLEKVLSARYLAVWETGWRYWMYNMLGIMVLTVFIDHSGPTDALSRKFYKTWGVFTGIWTGSALFTGTLCLVALNEVIGAGFRKMGAITPIGGTILIVSWLMGGVILLRHKKQV